MRAMRTARALQKKTASPGDARPLVRALRFGGRWSRARARLGPANETKLRLYGGVSEYPQAIAPEITRVPGRSSFERIPFARPTFVAAMPAEAVLFLPATPTQTSKPMLAAFIAASGAAALIATYAMSIWVDRSAASKD